MFLRQGWFVRHGTLLFISIQQVYRQKLLETVEKFREIPKRLKLVDWEAVRQVVLKFTNSKIQKIL